MNMDKAIEIIKHWSEDGDNDVSIWIKRNTTYHLHDLQNLFTDLSETGEELTFNKTESDGE